MIQLGERPETVHNVGALGVDSLTEVKLLSKSAIEAALSIKLRQKISLLHTVPRLSVMCLMKTKLHRY